MSTPTSSASTIVNNAVSAANPNRVRTWTQLSEGNAVRVNRIDCMEPLEWNVSPYQPLTRSKKEPVVHLTSPFVNKTG